MNREDLVRQLEQALPYVREGYAISMGDFEKQNYLMPWKDNEEAPEEILFKWSDLTSTDETYGQGWAWVKAPSDVTAEDLADKILSNYQVADSDISLLYFADKVGYDEIITVFNKLFNPETKQWVMEALEDLFDLPENLNEGNFEEFVKDMQLDPESVVIELDRLLTDQQILAIKEHLVSSNKITDSDLVPDTTPVETIENYLNSLLAEEYIAWFQYYSVIPFAVGNERESIVNTLRRLADDELFDHANKLIERINVLGMRCVINTPESWNEYAVYKSTVPASDDVNSIIDMNMQAETNAINHYTEAYNFAMSVGDVVTADIFKQILADEQKHLSDLRDFFNDLSK